MIKIWN